MQLFITIILYLYTYFRVNMIQVFVEGMTRLYKNPQNGKHLLLRYTESCYTDIIDYFSL